MQWDSAVANHSSPMLKCERSNIPPLLLGQETREVTGEACLRVWMSHASRVLSTRKISHMGGFRRTNRSELFADLECWRFRVRISHVFFFFFFFLPFGFHASPSRETPNISPLHQFVPTPRKCHLPRSSKQSNKHPNLILLGHLLHRLHRPLQLPHPLPHPSRDLFPYLLIPRPSDLFREGMF